MFVEIIITLFFSCFVTTKMSQGICKTMHVRWHFEINKFKCLISRYVAWEKSDEATLCNSDASKNENKFRASVLQKSHCLSWIEISDDHGATCSGKERLVGQINKWSEGGRQDSIRWKQKKWRIIECLVLSPSERDTSAMALSWYPFCVCQVLSGLLTVWAVDRFSGLWQITHTQVHADPHTHERTACLWQSKDHCQPILCNAGGR